MQGSKGMAKSLVVTKVVVFFCTLNNLSIVLHQLGCAVDFCYVLLRNLICQMKTKITSHFKEL